MIVEVDPDSPVPPFEQLRARLAQLIAAGQLAPGTRLPTVRQLAGDLGLAANTVARTYRALEADQLIDTRGRHGSFVAERPRASPARDRRARLYEAAAAYVLPARSVGAADDDVLDAVRRALGRG